MLINGVNNVLVCFWVADKNHLCLCGILLFMRLQDFNLLIFIFFITLSLGHSLYEYAKFSLKMEYQTGTCFIFGATVLWEKATQMHAGREETHWNEKRTHICGVLSRMFFFKCNIHQLRNYQKPKISPHQHLSMS